MTNTAYRLMFWGSDAVGVSVRNDGDYYRWKAGYYQLYENNVQQMDDVTLREFNYENDLTPNLRNGFSFWYINDRGNGEGGVSILGQGLNSVLNDYNGTFKFDLNGLPYKADIFWLGTYLNSNAEFNLGRWSLNGFLVSNFGTVRHDKNDWEKAADILGFAANIRAGYKYGQTAQDRRVINMKKTAKISDAKKNAVKELVDLAKKYNLIGAVDMENLPTKQLQNMRAQLRGKVELRMTKRRLIAKAFELGFQIALEYRANFLLSLISAAYPIFIQTFMWTAIYRNSAEAVVYGYTYRQMIAYTFLAGLVARIVHTGFEYDIMEDIKNGKYSQFLVQPVGYFAYRLSSFLGHKAPNLGMILIILALVLAGLKAVWGVSLGLSSSLIFLVTLVLAVVLNFLIFYCFSAVAFWIVEIGFLFAGIRIVTILLGGGIFPLEVFGVRLLQVINWLPFKYTISYPINVLNGKIPPGEAAQGMLIQCFWIAACYLLSNVLWRWGGRRYVAVGG